MSLLTFEQKVKTFVVNESKQVVALVKNAENVIEPLLIEIADALEGKELTKTGNVTEDTILELVKLLSPKFPNATTELMTVIETILTFIPKA